MKRIRSLRSLFLGRMHPKPIRPMVVVQRLHIRREGEQAATAVLVVRNRRPTVAEVANAVLLAIGIAAKSPRREEDGFTF